MTAWDEGLAKVQRETEDYLLEHAGAVWGLLSDEERAEVEEIRRKRAEEESP